MFNSTHTFVSFAVAKTGLDKWVPYAAVTAVVAGNLPDIEIFSGLSSTATYLDHHRGITHTLIGVPLLALLLAGAMYFFSGNFWKTYAVALIAMSTHPALDYLNTYGVRPFLPFSGKWYYGDLLFIFDPYVDLVLVLGLGAGAYFNRRRLMAWLSLILVVGYIGARVELRNLAASHLGKSNGEYVLFPTMLDPFRWEAIIATETQWVKLRVHSLHGIEGEMARIDRGSFSDIEKRAAATNSGEALLRFARFPAVRTEKTDSGYRVMFIDFRFYNEIRKTGLTAEILLDRSLHVTKENLSFIRSLD
jgi:inner membrane protein